VKPRFSPKADVYSFGMVCYEILTGHHPFQGHPRSNYDLVLSGQRPELPPFVNEGMSSLLRMCWLPDPLQRPEWDQIKSRLHKLEPHNSSSDHFGLSDVRIIEICRNSSSDHFGLPTVRSIEICRTATCTARYSGSVSLREQVFFKLRRIARFCCF
jgi:serine/threonine protein kinase